MKRIPCATYRLQFNSHFTFNQAFEILDYLRELGISDVYASPLFQAGPQSTHGYDTCCFGKINSKLGSDQDFERLTAALKERGLGLLLDVVPNHMSATLSNPWWFDVLQNGRDSPYAHFFDINWQPNNPALHDKVLLPVLEDQYEKVLKSGKLRLIHQDKNWFIAYHDRNFPVNLASVAAFGTTDPKKILDELNGTPGNARSFDKLDALIQRQHYRLAYWKVATEEINYRRFFDVTEMVALKMELPEVFHETHKLIFEWLDKGQVTGLRVDHPDGLWNPKEYLERLQKDKPLYVVVEKILSSESSDKPVAGIAPLSQKEAAILSPSPPRSGGEGWGEVVLRVHGEEQLSADWPTDGTTGYDFLNRANSLFVDSANASSFADLYHEFTGNETDFASLVYHSRKQVLERSFASELNALTHRFKDIAARTRSGHHFTFSELRGAIAEMTENFPVYRTYVTETSIEISMQDREVIQHAANAARKRAGMNVDRAAFDFLERLLTMDLGEELDQSGWKAAREFMMKFQQLTGPALAKGLEDTAFYRFNRFISLNEVGGDPGRFGLSPEEFHAANEVTAKRWPHTMLASSTHDTKRGEDLRARLNILSEMPGEWRETVTRWSQLDRDKKIAVENAWAPDANDEYLLYQTLVGAWPGENSSKPVARIEPVNQEPSVIPSPSPPRSGGEGWGEVALRAQGKANNDESLKTFRARIAAFMLKAAKEAKVRTSWTDPNAAYEKALQDFVDRVLATDGNREFLNDLRRFAQRVAFFGRFNSLSQTLLKMTSPGVPDFYQGAELWDLNLVDPDNRRSVDYALRQKILSELKRNFADVGDAGGDFFSSLLCDEPVGAIKMFLIWRALNFRATQRDLFDHGEYLPLQAIGEHATHVCAFARKCKERTIVVVVPRLVFGLTKGAELPPVGEIWNDTILQLPQARAGDLFRNVLTREMVPAVEVNKNAAIELRQAMKTFPVALLEKI